MWMSIKARSHGAYFCECDQDKTWVVCMFIWCDCDSKMNLANRSLGFINSECKSESETFLCSLPFNLRMNQPLSYEHTERQWQGQSQGERQIGSIVYIVTPPPRCLGMGLGPILEHQVEPLMYSNGTLPPLLLTLDTTLDSPLDAWCVYTLSLQLIFFVSISSMSVAGEQRGHCVLVM